MKFIIGKKIDMTQVWKGENVVAVTRVQAGHCAVAQVKTADKDGYQAVQVAYGFKKEKNINKPQLGHLKGVSKAAILKEFRLSDDIGLKKGDVIDAGSFEQGDRISITGVSKGKGFQGVVKRYGFSGSKKTHGNKDQLRMPGSVGATGPAHVFKGTRMGGRMGNDQVTLNNLEIIDIDKENNILLIKGALPGARNGLILISGEGEIKVMQAEPAEKPEEKKAEPKAEEQKEEKKPAPEEKKVEAKKPEAKKEEEKTAAEPKKEEAEKPAEKKTETPEEVEKEVVEAKEKVDAKKEDK